MTTFFLHEDRGARYLINAKETFVAPKLIIIPLCTSVNLFNREALAVDSLTLVYLALFVAERLVKIDVIDPLF